MDFAVFNLLFLCGSTNGGTHIWTIGLSEDVFVTVSIFVTNARDGAYFVCYIRKHQFDNETGGFCPVLLLYFLCLETSWLV